MEHVKEYKEFVDKNKAYFFDLDGTIIKTKSGRKFPKDIDDWIFNDGFIEALNKIKNDYLLFIVTNQGGIQSRMLKESDFKLKMKNIFEELSKKDINFTDYEYCPFKGENPCRKPNPGMILKLVDKYNIDISKSYMVGDASGLKGQFSDSDKKCAENAGLKYYDISEFL